MAVGPGWDTRNSPSSFTQPREARGRADSSRTALLPPGTRKTSVGSRLVDLKAKPVLKSGEGELGTKCFVRREDVVQPWELVAKMLEIFLN